MAVLLGGVGGVGVGAGWLAGVSPTRRSAWRSSSGVAGGSGAGRVGWPGSAPLDVAHGGPPRGGRGGRGRGWGRVGWPGSALLEVARGGPPGGWGGCRGRGGLAGRGQPHST